MMELANPANKWVNSRDSKNPEILAEARNIIANNIYCSLSTCSRDNYPWVSPIFFAYDEKLSIYWSSAVVSRHSENLSDNNGRAAIAIFNSSISEGKAKGVYFEGVAYELNQDCLETVIKLLQHRGNKYLSNKQLKRKVEQYQNNSPRRVYQFEPQKAWVSGNGVAVANQLVDTKIELNLPLLTYQQYDGRFKKL